MKKIILFGTFCCLYIPLDAQSTCQTRVDAHQEATTKQRVVYCLNPAPVAAQPSESGLIFSTVNAPVQPDEKSTEKATAKAGFFKPEHYSISQTYVESTQFPQIPQGQNAPLVMPQPNQAATDFLYVSSPTLEGDAAPNETLLEVKTSPSEAGFSASEGNVPAARVVPSMQQDDFVYVSSPSTPLGRPVVVVTTPNNAQPVAVTTPSTNIVVAPRERFMIDEIDDMGNIIAEVREVETKAGLKVRQNKPGRQMLNNVANESTASKEVQAPGTTGDFTYQEDLSQPGQEIPAGTVSYAPAPLPTQDTTYDEIPAGTVSYAPAATN